MKHQDIKSIVDKVGRNYLPDFDELFTSEITGKGETKSSGRYSLKKVKRSIPGDPEEIRETKLKVRISTDHAQRGGYCKEIGIVGGFVFKQLQEKNIWFEKVYLTTSEGKGYSKGRKKIIVDDFDCPSGYGYFIDEPHFATVLNFHDLPVDVRAARIEKFVGYYFEWITKNR